MQGYLCPRGGCFEPRKSACCWMIERVASPGAMKTKANILEHYGFGEDRVSWAIHYRCMLLTGFVVVASAP